MITPITHNAACRPRSANLAIGNIAALTVATILIAVGFSLGFVERAYANDAVPTSKLVASQSDADFYAALHADGELVFQREEPEDTAAEAYVAAVYEGSLAGYEKASAVPWHAGAAQVRTVRFAEDFKELQPLSFKCWFEGCSNLTAIDLSNLDASQSTTMEKMFKGCSSLSSVEGLSGFDTSSSTYFGSMFNGCASLKSLDVSHFDASHVRVLCFMFNGCSSLETLNMSGEGWNTSSLELMVHVWEGCSSLKSLDLSHLNTTGVRSMTYDFNGCTALKHLDLSGADTSNVGNLTHMLDGCSSLTTLKVGPRFSFNGASDKRQFDMPDGNWKSSATGAVFASNSVPNFVAATYTKTSEAVTGTTPAATPTKPVVTGIAVGKTAKAGGNTYKVTNNKKPSVTFFKAAKNASKVTVAAFVKIKGKRYAVRGIANGAFKGTAAKTVIVKARTLTKKSVKGCFKGAKKLKTVKVFKANKRAYKTAFAKPNSGKAVTVK